jgi:hypothetical protein
MKEQFTPGEWTIEKGDAFLDGSAITSESRSGMIPIVEVKYAYLDDEEKSEIETEQLANAYLLKAAPKMYRMLKEISEASRLLGYKDEEEMINNLLAEARGEK